MLPFIILVLHTVALWFTVVYLHKKRDKITLIPLYATISALMILTHVLSTAGLNIIFLNQFFLIASTAYFTPLLLSVLILYLFDGPKAAREALKIMVGVSLLLVITIFLVNLEDKNTPWISSVFSTYKNYFWSISALIIDVIVLGVFWELLNKIKKIPLLISVGLVVFLVFMTDSFIFGTGVFLKDPNYWAIIKSNFLVRSVLTLVISFFITSYLKKEKYSEENRQKPKNFWEILNFKSKEDVIIESLKTELEESSVLQRKLEDINTLYELVLTGSDVGIWTWNIKNEKLTWSDRFFEILGYKPKEFDITFDNWMKSVHPEDRDKVITTLDGHAKKGLPFKVKYRIKNKEGDYIWLISSAKMKFNEKGEGELMAGSVTDITQEIKAEEELNKKLDDLTALNKLMVGRELKMIELKQQLETANN